MRSDRSNLEDGRVHAALYFIEPTGHSYDRHIGADAAFTGTALC